MSGDNYTISTPGYKSCQYTFNLTSPLACPASKDLGGWIVIIIAIVCFSLYCAIGSVVNWKKYEMTGVQIIPNSTFWLDLPSLVKDGCIFFWVRTLRVFGQTSSLDERTPLV